MLLRIYKNYIYTLLFSDINQAKLNSSGFPFLAYWFFCILLLSACPSSSPLTPSMERKYFEYYCSIILDMSINERQNFLSSKEGNLFKKKYEGEGYITYDEKNIQAFCEDIKTADHLKSDTAGSHRRGSRRKSSSRGGSSSSSPSPCPENGVFPPENQKLSYIRFEEYTNKYTEYTHKKYRKISNANNPEDKGEAEDENGDTHRQDIFLHSFFVNGQNVFIVIVDKELIEYEQEIPYYLYLSEVEANNGDRKSRRLELNPGKEYTIYYWPPTCADDPANSDKCECQTPDQTGCLSGKPEDPNWNRDALSSIQGLPSNILHIFSTVTFQVFSAKVNSESIGDYFQDQKQTVHLTSEKNGNCAYYADLI